MTWDELVAREVRRLRFLANKLIGDMEDAGKVFVWWQRTPITLAEIVPLFLAMRRRGRIRLLWIELGEFPTRRRGDLARASARAYFEAHRAGSAQHARNVQRLASNSNYRSSGPLTH